MPGMRFSPEQQAKAVRLAEATPQHGSQWTAIESVDAKIGASAETVRKWVRRAEIDAGNRPGMSSEEHAEIKRLRREVAELRRANEILKAAAAFFGPSSTGHSSAGEVRRRAQGPPRRRRVALGSRADLRGAHRARSRDRPATYYAPRSREPSPRAVRDTQLKAVICRLHEANYGVYGVRKMHAALVRDGVEVGRDQTARLMRELGLAGVRRGRFKRTTVTDPAVSRPVDLGQPRVPG